MMRSPETLLVLFENRELDPAGFRHRDHVALAWALLRRDPPLEAMQKYIAGLKQLTLSVGRPEAYHATITWAFLLLVQERLGRDREAAWEVFERNNGDLFASKPSVLERYYQPETLGSELARQVFLLPDRLAA
jgi:hypothetical protein